MILSTSYDKMIYVTSSVYTMSMSSLIYIYLFHFKWKVVGVPDKRLGEEICAWVELKSNEHATEEEIKAFCKAKVSVQLHRLVIIPFENFTKSEYVQEIPQLHTADQSTASRGRATEHLKVTQTAGRSSVKQSSLSLSPSLSLTHTRCLED